METHGHCIGWRQLIKEHHCMLLPPGLIATLCWAATLSNLRAAGSAWEGRGFSRVHTDSGPRMQIHGQVQAQSGTERSHLGVGARQLWAGRLQGLVIFDHPRLQSACACSGGQPLDPGTQLRRCAGAWTIMPTSKLPSDMARWQLPVLAQKCCSTGPRPV